MAKHAFWIHGHAFQPQREGYFLNKVRVGCGAVFKTHGAEWFHVAIPTPVILQNTDSKLKKFFVLYQTSGTAKLTAVHIWDGISKIAGFDKIAYSGDHSTKLDKYNSWNVNPVHIKFGLGISVHVEFGPPSKIGVPEITFATAGAEFLTS